MSKWKYYTDADGNMLHGPLDGQMADFTYDCRNRLIKVVTESGEVTEYTYDAENIRLGTTTETQRSTFVTDREATYSQLLVETIEEKGLLGIYTEKERKTYTYGIGLLSEHRNSSKEILYYHYNNIGSTTEVTNQSGSIVGLFSYGTYGELLSCDEDIDIRFLYNGYYGVQTDKNNLYYMRARYYNPSIKRFINRDILTGSMEESQSLNRYIYVQGNPVHLTDPFGLCAQDSQNQLIHMLLDGMGFAWDGADLINAALYAMEGDTKNAMISMLGALPVVGLIGAVGYKTGKGLIKAAKLSGSGGFLKSIMKAVNNLSGAMSKYGRKTIPDVSSLIAKVTRKGGKADNAAAIAKTAAKSGTETTGDIAKIVKKADARGYESGSQGLDDIENFYNDIFDQQRSGIPEYEDYLDTLTGNGNGVPDNAYTVANYIQRNGSTLPGYKGGRKYQNIPSNVAGQTLPQIGVYNEYDINKFIKGKDRGAERIVIGEDASVWYTNNHYLTFTKIK